MALSVKDKKHIISSMIGLGYAPKAYIEGALLKARKELLLVEKSDPYRIAIHQVLIKEFEDLREKIEDEKDSRYKKVYKEEIQDTLKKAKAGDQKAIFRLIEWDKEFLFEDWIRLKIIAADAVDNRKFINGLTDAIKSRKNKIKTTHEKIFKDLKYLKVMGFNFNNSKKVNQLRESMLEKHYEIGTSEDDPVFKLLIDADYFSKYLKRVGLKSGQ